MLLTLMMNLNMFGGVVPPPTPSGEEGGEIILPEKVGSSRTYEKKQDIEKERREFLLRDDNEILDIIKMYFKTRD